MFLKIRKTKQRTQACFLIVTAALPFCTQTTTVITNMSSSESGASDEDSDFEEIYENPSNAFSFEPEYTEEEVQERLTQHFSQPGEEVIDFEPHSEAGSPGENDERCNCDHCVEMANDFEQVCCQANTSIIGNKFGVEKCIAQTVAFSDVCLNTNVLEASLGAWTTFTEEPLTINNKSYRIISYRQYISWIYGWL